jgi:hypothetical protein
MFKLGNFVPGDVRKKMFAVAYTGIDAEVRRYVPIARRLRRTRKLQKAA